MHDEETFHLTEDDETAIEIATKMAHEFLKHESIEPEQIVGLGHALYALNRLPLTTPGVFVEFGVMYSFRNEDTGGRRYIEFAIEENVFRITLGGNEWDKRFGHDNYSRDGWYIGSGTSGARECAIDLWTVEEEFQELFNLGGRITVTDESEIEFEFE